MKPICLTIAGSDPTSGAGIQADIRTFDRIGVHPFSAITALTYQTATEFTGYTSLSSSLNQQLEVLFETYHIKVIKVGMIPDNKILEIIYHYVKTYKLDVVLDPVSISSVGKRLSSEGLELEMKRDLFPLVKVLTPNISEASYFSNIDILSFQDIKFAKKAGNLLLDMILTKDDLLKKEKAIIIKSIPNFDNGLIDLACIYSKIESNYEKSFQIFNKRKLNLEGNVHGTGCVFSSAIAAYLAKNYPLQAAIEMAETFFDEKFQRFIELPSEGKLLDLTLSNDKIDLINQVKEIYNFISNKKEFCKLIPEVRMNISGALPNAKNKEEIAGIEGRITIVNGFPHKCGEIKFGVSDHTARLILSAKEFDNTINFVINLKFEQKWIQLISSRTDLKLQEFIREEQPDEVKKKEFSTMQWLIKNSIEKHGEIPDIIWDTGSIGKEPIIRLFGRDSKEMIEKLRKIISVI
ncbi:MAG: bifunctional hydroxymethylpyrimidine kinase/phosphomethylpyrimidine kinase [Candidatus Lokiarchaeota archaeon]|nr:bifunctional hydroxymethylpyrimidine kinase/phosphomethylpyrimidine kinase [Candidatus Lokiarchaeota archaeon]